MHSDHSNVEKAHKLLKQFYGYTSFRPGQLDIISHTLAGKDSLVLMPTGGGKSICFQIPALMLDGITIVISPLLALMKDQVEGLQNCGIPAASLNSLQTESQNREIINALYHGRIKLLYVSPERFISEIEQWKESLKISLVAIDEAHCISQWGHDFRLEYTQLGIIRDLLPDVPVMALTATADRTTRLDIVKQLRLRSPQYFISSFDRPNLSLRVVSGANKEQRLKIIEELIRRHPGESGIIYCLSRKIAEQMAAELSKKKYRVEFYHAGMTPDERNKVQNDFVCDNIDIVCATVAFGMGIDKSNIRWVVHNNLPQSIENYYQEIGRAGRDGLPAETLLFYSLSDVIMRERLVAESQRHNLEMDKLRRMRDFAESTVCRRRMLLSYFNEPFEHDCGNCDVCANPPVRFDGTRLAQMALSAIARTNGEAGFSMLTEILRGISRHDIMLKGFNRIKTFGVGHEYSKREWDHYLEQMFQLGLYEVDYANSRRFVITEYGRKVLFAGETVQFSEYRTVKAQAAKARTEFPTSVIADDISAGTETNSSAKLFQYLKQLRLNISRKKNNLPAYLIFSDKVLTAMTMSQPVTREEFEEIPGIGKVKANLYWHAFVNVIRQFKRLEPLPEEDEINRRLVAAVESGTSFDDAARMLGFTTRNACQTVASLIDNDSIENIDSICPRKLFLDVINMSRTLSETRFIAEVTRKYCDGIELVVFAAANAMLRKCN